MKNKDYYIGLDIGSNSIGWAVTDTDYNILKKNRKFLFNNLAVNNTNDNIIFKHFITP